MMRVQEVTHHGEVYRVRVIDMPKGGTVEEVERMLVTGPYRVSSPTTRGVTAEIQADLRRDGNATHGWVRYTAIPASVVAPRGTPGVEGQVPARYDTVSRVERAKGGSGTVYRNTHVTPGEHRVIERVLWAMTEHGEVYADRYVDDQGRAWVAPCGTSVDDTDAWADCEGP